MQGEIAQGVLTNNSEKLEEALDDYIEIFGREDFYIEIQDTGVSEQRELNRALLALAREKELKAVVTNDVHYINKGDHTLQDILICIQTGQKVNDTKRMKIESKDMYLKSREELEEVFPDNKKELDISLEIAKKCNLELEFGKFKFPEYPLEEGKNIDDFLKELVYKGLEKRYEVIDEKIRARADYELDVILSMGYSSYFVIVWDFIDYAKKMGIPVGPGRGSAAGSIVAYALEITELDPIKYNLIFERFLNPERISMPDIDVDICRERRSEVISYVANKYGSEHVAQIITFGTLKARAAIRDVGRVLGIALTKVDKIAKLIPSFSTLENALKEVDELRELYEGDSECRTIIEISKGLENRVRHASVHAAGIVMTKEPLIEDVPLYIENSSKTLSTQYQMKELEELGLLKMDFLGLKTLTVLEKAVENIKENKGIKINLNKIKLEDEKTFDLLKEADTLGVFQFESRGIRELMRKLSPDKFEDIIALLALYRPGPLGSGMVDEFILAKKGLKEIRYPHESLKEVLEETYGVILYQEQVMKIANIMADYSLGEADLLRRAMGKKNLEIMEENRQKFVSRSVKNGYLEKKAVEIFNLIEKFAGYGFNKSHSAAYALIAYQTAYLKSNYPNEFYGALMSSEKNNLTKLGMYIERAKKQGIEIKTPSINRISSNFIAKDDYIVFGMSAIKNLGSKLIEELELDLRENGEYENFEEFLKRGKKIGVNKKNIEAFIFSGSLDELPGNRKQKFLSIDKLLKYIDISSKEDDIQQMNLFGLAKKTIERFEFPKVTEYSLDKLLKGEKELLGFYLSGHPLDIYKAVLETYDLNQIKNLNESSKTIVRICGILDNVKKLKTKSTGKTMATGIIEDYKNSIPCVIFPREFENFGYLFLTGEKLFVEGEVQNNFFNGKEEKKLIVKKILPIEEIGKERNFKVYILTTSEKNSKNRALKKLLLEHSGSQRVFLSLEDKKISKKLDESFNIEASQEFIEKVEKLLGKGKILVK